MASMSSSSMPGCCCLMRLACLHDALHAWLAAPGPSSRAARLKREKRVLLCPKVDPLCRSKGSGTEMHRKAGPAACRRNTHATLSEAPDYLEDCRAGWVRSPTSRTSRASLASSPRFLSSLAGHLAGDLGRE